jgi:primosomal protein N' (replication factor Y)
MREELKAGNRGVFSFALRKAVASALESREQAILFVNRRGSARFILCRDCGYLPLCPSCEVAMSLDLSDPVDPKVLCHHCGRSKRLEGACPRCGGPRYRPFGVGTQRIEQLARAEFPQARVARWDSDTAARKGSHERILQAVESREVDILVGTQMLAKGLDLPAMTVVGVVDADVGLSLPDYHAHERVFQLLTQVAGRAGRREAAGQVFIQTYNPEAPPIAFAGIQDYRGFYDHEIAHRRRAGYPPFTRLVRLVHSHASYERGLEEASRLAAELRTRRDAAGRAEPDILGPGRPYIARVRGRYRWQVLLRGRDPASLVAPVRLGEGWTVDVDPVSLT